jgi:RNA polymerase-binding transcription factor DksA
MSKAMSEYDKIYQVLIAKRDQLELRINKIKQDYATTLNRDSEEQATELENSEVLQAIEGEAAKELEQVKGAIQRIQNNEYEICASCGAKISSERLQAIPYATHCISCAENH